MTKRLETRASQHDWLKSLEAGGDREASWIRPPSLQLGIGACVISVQICLISFPPLHPPGQARAFRRVDPDSAPSVAFLTSILTWHENGLQAGFSMVFHSFPWFSGLGRIRPQIKVSLA